jgi:pyrroline-5-carboxylate reductase
MNAAKKNYLGIGLGGLITEPERIADEIGHFLDLPDLIVVRENDGVALALQFRDVRRQIQTVVYTCSNHRLISPFGFDAQMSAAPYRFGFIGAGKLAGSVIRGLLLKNFCAPDAILASEPNVETRAQLQTELGISLTTENSEIAAKADILFLGVKPQMVLPVLRELGDTIANKLVVSLAAGIRIAQMEEITPARIMRVLTNTPSAIGKAASAFASGRRPTDQDREKIRAMFGAIGLVVEVDDEQIDAISALAGSGPAFVYAMIEALARGGEKMGLDKQASLQLAAQSALGAAELMMTSGKSPAELIKMVVTPGGTTAAGLRVMDERSVAAALADAVEAATKRGQEMGKENL